MKFKFVGIYQGNRYELQGDGVTSIYGEFISFHYQNDYYAIGAAYRIQKWVLVPDGSSFNHYFETVEIYVDGRLMAEVRGKSLYRYFLWP